MRVALVSPDALTVLLFWKGLIRRLQEMPGVDDVVVVSDEQHRGPELRALGIRTRHIETNRFLNPWADFKYIVRLTRIFRRERCAIAFLCCTKPNVYGALAARLAGVRTTMLHVQGLGAAFVPGGLLHAIVRGILTLLYWIACRLSAKVWFVNPNDADHFVSRGLVKPEQVVVTTNYLDPDEYSPALAGDVDRSLLMRELGLDGFEQVVVMVGRLIAPKGVREYAEAATLLRERYPKAAFLLLGQTEEGQFDPVPESYIHACERNANLRWLGFRDDIKRIYTLADIAVLPTYYKEGLPRGLLEPMAMGKPIITTDSLDCRAAVEHGKNGYTVPAKDARTLAAAIASLLDDPDQRSRFGAYSRLKVEREFNERRIVPAALTAMGLSTLRRNP